MSDQHTPMVCGSAYDIRWDRRHRRIGQRRDGSPIYAVPTPQPIDNNPSVNNNTFSDTRFESWSRSFRLRAGLTVYTVGHECGLPATCVVDPPYRVPVTGWYRAVMTPGLRARIEPWPNPDGITDTTGYFQAVTDGEDSLPGEGHPDEWRDPERPPTIRVYDTATDRTLLTLDVVDGRMTAAYDPDDLDEATQLFIAEVLRHADAGRRLTEDGDPLLELRVAPWRRWWRRG